MAAKIIGNVADTTAAIQLFMSQDKSRHGWLKRIRKWTIGADLLSQLTTNPNLSVDAVRKWSDWVDDDLMSATTFVNHQMVLTWSFSVFSFLENSIELVSFCSKDKTELELIVNEENGPLGILKRAGMMLKVLSGFVLTTISQSVVNSDEAVVQDYTRVLIKLIRLCVDGKIENVLAHHNLGKLLHDFVSSDARVQKVLIDDEVLGFREIGALLYRSQSSTLTSTLLCIAQVLLPKQTHSKNSLRTIACKSLVQKQGWNQAIVSEGFYAIGNIDGTMLPKDVVKCINIFTNGSEHVRPTGYELKSFIINGVSQVDTRSGQQFQQTGPINVFLDRYGWTFMLIEENGQEFPRMFTHTSISQLSRTPNIEKITANYVFIASSPDDEPYKVEFSINAAYAESLELILEELAVNLDHISNTIGASTGVSLISKEFRGKASTIPVNPLNRKTRFSTFSYSMMQPSSHLNITAESTSAVYSKPATNPTCKYNGQIGASIQKVNGSVIKLKKEKKGSAELSDSGDEIWRPRVPTPLMRSKRQYGSRSSTSRRAIQSHKADQPSSSDTDKKTGISATGSTHCIFSRTINVASGMVASPLKTSSLKTKAKSLAKSIREGRAAPPGSGRGSTAELTEDAESDTTFGGKSLKSTKNRGVKNHRDVQAEKNSSSTSKSSRKKRHRILSSGSEDSEPESLTAASSLTSQRRTVLPRRASNGIVFTSTNVECEISESEVEAYNSRFKRNKISYVPQSDLKDQSPLMSRTVQEEGNSKHDDAPNILTRFARQSSATQRNDRFRLKNDSDSKQKMASLVSPGTFPVKSRSKGQGTKKESAEKNNFTKQNQKDCDQAIYDEVGWKAQINVENTATMKYLNNVSRKIASPAKSTIIRNKPAKIAVMDFQDLDSDLTSDYSSDLLETEQNTKVSAITLPKADTQAVAAEPSKRGDKRQLPQFSLERSSIVDQVSNNREKSNKTTNFVKRKRFRLDSTSDTSEAGDSDNKTDLKVAKTTKVADKRRIAAEKAKKELCVANVRSSSLLELGIG
nr:hypothetical protein L204_04965 [Cryptococcus depauperatus CBS 7855]